MTKSKERSPAMQFYFRQFSGDEAVMAMDLDAVGAHILLMCAAGSASSGYKIEADERAIRTRLRNPNNSDFERIKGQLLAGAWKISEDGKHWVQEGMKRTLLKQKEFSRKQKENARKRWGDAKSMPDECQKDAKAMPSSSSTSSSTSEDLKKEIKEKKGPRFPANLQTEDCRAAWASWLKHKQTKKQKYQSVETEERALANWAEATPEEFIAAVNFSIGNNYSGIFADKRNGATRQFQQKKTPAQKTFETGQRLYEQAILEEQANAKK